MNVTTAEYQRIIDSRRMRGFPIPAMEPAKPKPPRGMNKTESAYARRLDLLKQQGEVLWWAFEPISLRLTSGMTGGKCRMYKPDFLVVIPLGPKGGGLEFHELKGHAWESGIIRFDVAAEMNPWATFRMFGHDGGEWIMRREKIRSV